MAVTRRKDQPQDYTGGREVIWIKTPCGWCLDKICQSCKHEVAYYEKLWICGCECNKDWVPQDVGAYEIKRSPKKVEEELPDDLPDVRVSTEAGTDPTDEDTRGNVRSDHDGDETDGSDPVGQGTSSDGGEAEEE